MSKFTIVSGGVHGQKIVLTETIGNGTETHLCTDGRLHTSFYIQNQTVDSLYFKTDEQIINAIKLYKEA